MRKKNTKRIPIIILFVAMLVGFGIFYWVAKSNRSVGSVNNKSISKTAYEDKINQSKTFYEYAKQTPAEKAMEKAAFDTLVANTLVEEYVRKNNVIISDSTVQNRYIQIVAGYNRNHNIPGGDDALFLKTIEKMYGIDKSTYLQQVRLDLLKEQIQEKEKMPYAKWLEKEKKKASIIRN